jgi:hypothetical protein
MRNVSQEEDGVAGPAIAIRNGLSVEPERLRPLVVVLADQFALPSSVGGQFLQNALNICTEAEAGEHRLNGFPQGFLRIKTRHLGESGIGINDPVATVGDDHGVGQRIQHALGQIQSRKTAIGVRCG